MPILVGTCAWSDHENFYPRGVKSSDYLEYYAQYFPLVEVDSTFYHIPAPKQVQGWADRTPPHFMFNVKAYRLLTRHLRYMRPEDRTLPLDEAFKQFLAAVEPLWQAGKLGLIHFQFPPSFACDADNRKYLDFCREQLQGWPLSIEFRHRSWWEGEQRQRTLEWLRGTASVHTISDEPQVGKGSVPAVVEVTNPNWSLVRFHGRNEERWYGDYGSATERFKYKYSQEELREWVKPVRRLAGQVDVVQVLMNNNYSNWAIQNAFDLAQLLDLGYQDPFPQTRLF